MSQKDVGDAAGIHQQSIGKLEFESGKTTRINGKTKERLVYALSVPGEVLEARASGC